MKNDKIKSVRRAQLKKWVSINGVPQKEKSLFSQLMNDDDSSFGERVSI